MALLFSIGLYALMVMSVSAQDDGGCGNYAEVFEPPVVDDRIRSNPDVPHDFGSIASLHTSTSKLGLGTQRCGATIISHRFLITAAHCVTGRESLLGISVGRENLNENSQNWTDSYLIEEIFVHPNYSSNSPVRYNDIAILKTEKNIIYSNKIWPMCLPEKDFNHPDFTPLQIAGWGQVNQGHRSSVLKSAFVKVVKNSRCESDWQRYNQYHNLLFAYPQGLTSNVMCAGRRGADACYGDSGGPLSHQGTSGRHVLVGVIARGISVCADTPVLPGFYTNVANYIDWIRSVTIMSAPVLSDEPQLPPLRGSISVPPSSSSGLIWDRVGSDNFITITDKKTWQEGRDFCKSYQLDIYQPNDTTRVGAYLRDNYGVSDYWVGAQGNGHSIVWVSSGEQLTSNDLWGNPGDYRLVGAGWCMVLQTCCGDRHILGMWTCTGSHWPFLCG